MGDDNKAQPPSLLDQVLEDTQARRGNQTADPAGAADAEPPSDPPAFDNLQAIAALTDEDLRSVISQINPDRLLVALATAEAAFRKRVLDNLGAEAREWMLANLPYLDKVTEAAKRDAQGAVLEAASQLAARGRLQR